MSSCAAFDILWLVATAEGHSYPLSEWLRFAVVVFNFAVFIFILYRFGRQPIAKAISSRRKQFLDDLEQARRAKEEAEKLLSEARAKLEAADAEASALVEDAKRRADLLAQEIIQSAQISAQKLLEEARSAAKAEADRVFLDMKRDVIARAIDEAERMLKDRLSVEDDRRLVDEAIRDLLKDDKS